MEYNIDTEERMWILIKGRKLLFGIKKGTLGEQEPSVQSAEVEEICIYQHIESGRHNISENKNSGFHASEESQVTIS